MRPEALEMGVCCDKRVFVNMMSCNIQLPSQVLISKDDLRDVEGTGAET